MAQPSGTISGNIHDTAGRALAGATITATRGTTDPAPAVAHSDAQGKFLLAGLAAESYTLTVSLAGFGAPAAREVRAGASADFQLAPLPAAKPPLQFEAAGVRGLIDPGGYSAPANAAAASGVLSGMANIKSADNTTARAFPCGMEQGLKQAAAATPPDREARTRLGEFYLAHGRFDAALPLFAELTAARQDARAYRLWAQALEGTGQFPQAAQAYQSAAALDPSEDNLFGAGYELILAGSADAAASTFRDATRKLPRSAKLWTGQGAAEFLAAHPVEAVHALLQAIELDTAGPRPYRLLNTVSGISQAEAARVETAFRRYTEVAPGSAEAFFFYARHLARDGADTPADPRTIENLLKKSLALDATSAKCHFQLAALYANQGRMAEAAGEYRKTVDLAPELSDAHYRLATAYRQTGQEELAAQEYRKFQEVRQHEKEQSDSGAAIEQFISVFGTRGDSPNAPGPCPAVP